MNNIGTIQFTSTDKALNDGFAWAKEQALYYAHDSAHVGLWYEAALPGRDAFCIRDVCHQANGAHALGLEHHTKNMLLRFVQSIAASRDYCCFWEIDKNYRPAPVDYKSDADFWYNLPANFDLLTACLRMYKLTGDRDYIESEDFLHFYRLTVDNYIKKWDINGDGIPEGSGTRRGIPSYEEGEGGGAAQMLDLLASETAALRSYAEICELRGENGVAYKKWADAILAEIDKRWDEKEEKYFFIKQKDGTFSHISYSATIFIPYFDAAIDERKGNTNLDKLHQRTLDGKINVEEGSYLAEIFYRYGQYDRAEQWLRYHTAPGLKRREYPEVSFASVGAYVFGMMGVAYNCVTKTISAEPHLPAGVTSASLTGLPVFGKTADITVDNGRVTIVYSE